MELDAHELELGLGMIKGGMDDRPSDKELRILMFTAAYFVLDGVTLTIRRLEAHLRANGATVKILTTVPDDIDPKQTEHVIRVPGIKIPFADAGTGYAFGVGLDENIVRELERFNPNCVHFTVPDFVALDGIRWCQRNNVAYIATWHSNYVDYLKYYFLEWVLGPAFHRYLKGFYEQIPAVYIPTPYVSALPSTRLLTPLSICNLPTHVYTHAYTQPFPASTDAEKDGQRGLWHVHAAQRVGPRR